MYKAGLILGLFLCIAMPSCKKIIQQQEQNALVSLITNGVWYVTLYASNKIDSTSAFAGYNFQFRSDGTVTGTKDSISITGTWAGDIANRTITSDFPAGSGILNDLDAVFMITDSGTDYVVAYTGADSTQRDLKLQKR